MSRKEIRGIFKKSIETNTLPLSLIIILALLLRIPNIEKWESGWLSNEIAFLLFGEGILKSHPLHYPLFNGFIYPFLSTLVVSIAKEVGKAILISRMINIFISIVTIFIFYFFTKNYFDEDTALIATFLITIFPSHVFISKMGVETSLALFFSVTSLYFLCKFIRCKKEIFFYLFVITSGLGVLTHLSIVLFLMTLIPFLISIRSQINERLVILSLFIFILLVHPLTDYTSHIPYHMSHLEEGTITDVKYNLVRGAFLLFPSFLGGDVSSHCLFRSPSLLFFFSLICFILCVSRESKKELTLLLSFLIGIVLVSTLTISTFRAITFYILIPVICVMSARSILFFYKKLGIGIFLVLLLLSLGDIFFVIKESSKTISTFYPSCIREVAENIVSLEYDSLFVPNLGDLEDPLLYRLYEITGNIFNNMVDIPTENSLVIFVSSKHPFVKVDMDAKEKFINKLKALGYVLYPIKNITCENVIYHFYFLRKRG